MVTLAQSESDDLAAFRALHGTESRRSTSRDKPTLTGIHRPIEETTRLLGTNDG